jgi:hypothetical protein
MKGIIVIFVFVGSLMSIQFFAFPKIKEVRQQWADIADMQQILADAERTKEDRIAYLDRLSNVDENDLRKLSLLVPNQIVSEDLYVFLNDIIKDSGLRAKSISVADVNAKATEKQNQKALTFDVNVIGPYGNMRKLLNLMEINLRLMDVDTLKILRSLDPADPKSFYSLTIQGRFYYAGNEQR